MGSRQLFIQTRDYLRRVRKQQEKTRPKLVITEILPTGRDKRNGILELPKSEA